MRAGWHLVLSRILQLPAMAVFYVVWLFLLGAPVFLLGFLVEAIGLDVKQISWLGWVFWVFCIVLFIVIVVLSVFSGCFVVEWLFREVIPARCPKCGGRFRLGYEKRRGERFAVYECEECGHRWEWKSKLEMPVGPPGM